MKKHIRARLIEITEWSRDQRKIDGGLSRGDRPSVLTDLTRQVRERLEDCAFRPQGLPFEYDFDVDPAEDYPDLEGEVKDRLLDEYINTFMENDYVVPTDCEFEYETMKEQE